MSIVEPGKWTCESCNRTVTVHASEPDQRAAIHACQERHWAAHTRAATIVARMGLPGRNPDGTDVA